MNTTKLYQLRDRVARAVTGPIMKFQHDGPAIRVFHGVLEDKNTGPGQHPKDYDLVYLGTQNEETGVITPHGLVQGDNDTLLPPETVATGASWHAAREEK